MKSLLALIEDLSRTTVLPEGFRFYLFGSAIQKTSTPSDVDLMLAYANGCLNDAHAVAKAIRSMAAVPPYDASVASETEAAQLDLVAKQDAILIWPIASLELSHR